MTKMGRAVKLLVLAQSYLKDSGQFVSGVNELLIAGEGEGEGGDVAEV